MGLVHELTEVEDIARLKSLHGLLDPSSLLDDMTIALLQFEAVRRFEEYRAVPSFAVQLNRFLRCLPEDRGDLPKGVWILVEGGTCNFPNF